MRIFLPAALNVLTSSSAAPCGNIECVFGRSNAVAQHITRRELKKDEVRETLTQGAELLLAHEKTTIYVVIVAVIIALGVLGWRAHTQRQTVKASAAFNSAMTVYEAPVIAAGQPAPPSGQLVFTQESAKYSEASKKFSEVASQYPRTRSGRLAGYYAALSAEKLGRDDVAKKALQSLAGGDGDFAAMARFALAQLDDQTGNGIEAEKLYQQLMAKPTDLAPKPLVMLALAEHYGQKNPAEAAKLYEQIRAEYPESTVAEQAGQELSLLPGKS